jgi:hypothetical protein
MRKEKKKLTFSKETLARLSEMDLTRVAGLSPGSFSITNCPHCDDSTVCPHSRTCPP